jgi:hypothetical protein
MLNTAAKSEISSSVGSAPPTSSRKRVEVTATSATSYILLRTMPPQNTSSVASPAVLTIRSRIICVHYEVDQRGKCSLWVAVFLLPSCTILQIKADLHQV